MSDPPIDNWTQADEDCYNCKHRLDCWAGLLDDRLGGDAMSDWRDLPAGPELDALVAERVLGWRWCRGGTYGVGILLPESSFDSYAFAGLAVTEGKPKRLGGDWDRELTPLRLSTSWAGAGLVVEAMDARGHTLVLYRLRARVTWKAEFSSACCQETETAPMAICRASLAALEMVAMEAAS